MATRTFFSLLAYLVIATTMVSSTEEESIIQHYLWSWQSPKECFRSWTSPCTDEGSYSRTSPCTTTKVPAAHPPVKAATKPVPSKQDCVPLCEEYCKTHDSNLVVHAGIYVLPAVPRLSTTVCRSMANKKCMISWV